MCVIYTLWNIINFSLMFSTKKYIKKAALRKEVPLDDKIG